MKKSKKVNKWDAAPESIRKLKELIDKQRLSISLGECEDLIRLNALEKVLCDYNELEAKHQLDCGLISDYAEEIAWLKQKNEKASNNIRDLRRVLEENDIATYLNPVTVSWGVANVALQKKTEHFNTQLDNLREKLKEAEKSKENWIAHYHDISDICSRNEDDYEMLQRMLEKDGYTVEYDDDIDDETVHCRCTSDYILRGTTSDEVTLQFGRWTLKRPQTFSEAEANAKVAELTAKLIESEFDLARLKKKYEFQKEKNIELASKNKALGMEISERCKQIHELKDALEKDGELLGEHSKLIDEINQLEKKNDELKKENNNLTTDTKRLGDAVEAWFNMFNDMRHKRDFLKKEYEKLKETNKSLRRTVRILDEEGWYV